MIWIRKLGKSLDHRAMHGSYRLKQSQISYNAIHKCIAIGDVMKTLRKILPLSWDYNPKLQTIDNIKKIK